MQCATLTSLLEATRTLEQHREGFNLWCPGALTLHQPLLSTSGWEAARAQLRALAREQGWMLPWFCQHPSRQAPYSEPAQQCGDGIQQLSQFLWLHLWSPRPSPAYLACSLLFHLLLPFLPPSSSVRETSEGYCLACLFLHYLSCRGQSQTSRGQS